MDLHILRGCIKDAAIAYYSGTQRWGATVDMLLRLLDGVLEAQVLSYGMLSENSPVQYYQQTKGITPGLICAVQCRL